MIDPLCARSLVSRLVPRVPYNGTDYSDTWRTVAGNVQTLTVNSLSPIAIASASRYGTAVGSLLYIA